MSKFLSCVLLSGILAWTNSGFAREAIYQLNGDLVSETGQADLEPADQSPGGGPSVTFGTAMIGGAPADIATLGGNTHLRMRPDCPPNAGGNFINDYSLVIDMAVPGRGGDCSGTWVSFYQSSTANDSDGEMFVNPGGGLGISGDYAGCIDAEWHRIAMCISADPPLMQCFIDGALVNEVSLDGLDGRWSLYGNDMDDSEGVLIFGDENGDVPPEILVNSVLFVDRRLTAGEVGCLGGPTADGIPGVCVPNDDCADAIEVVVPSVSAGNTTNALPENLGVCGSNDSASVWYQVAGTGNEIIADTCGSAFDTILGVYEGSCGALVCVDSNDDTCDIQSRVSWNSTAGTTYFLEVHGFGVDEFGDYMLTISGPLAPPDNDLCVDAEPVGDVFPVTVSGTTAAASADETGSCAANDSPAVWYSVVGSGGILSAETCGSSFDTRLSVYEGDCGGLACVVENDDSCDTQSRVSWESVAGTTYLISLFGFDAERHGDFTLTVDSVVPCSANDVCDAAVELDFSKEMVAVVSGVTTPCTTDPENNECGNSDAPGLWYYVSGSGGTITASVCNAAGFDSRISVFEGGCGALTCVTENDDADGCAGNTSETSWVGTVGTDYFILVHGFNTNAGEFTLTVDRPVPPCVRIVDCTSDSDTGMISVAWESFAVDHDGFEVTSNGESVGSVGPGETTFSFAPALAAGGLNDFAISVRVTGDGVVGCTGGSDDCTVWLSPGNVCLSDNFNSYATDADVEIAGWFFVDENAPVEQSTWTVTNPGGRANPPTVDGSPSSGGFLISDSDAQSGSNQQGTGQSHDLWSPLFDCSDKDSVWLHMDASVQLNNNGTAVFDVDVSLDEGASWANVFRRVAPCRVQGDPCGETGLGENPIDAEADDQNSDGFFGRLDVDLSSVAAGQSNVRFRLRHFEPDFDWWIAVDNVVVDDVSPPNGANRVNVFEEDFSTGLGQMSAISAGGNTCNETWHTTDKGGRLQADGAISQRGANRLSALQPVNIDTAQYAACLSGGQEVPPVDTEGSGSGSFLVDFTARTLLIDIEHSGLSGPATGAHIHRAAPGENGPVVFSLAGIGGPGSPIQGSWSMTDDDIAGLIAGELYVDVHTEAHGPGEIRGQIRPESGFAIIDSDANPDPDEDEWLVTPVLDLSEIVDVRFSFLSETIVSGAVQEVLLSLDGGETFLDRPIFSYTTGALVDGGEEPFFAERIFPVPQADGQSEVVFAFHWVGRDNWWWAVDNIVVSGLSPVVGGLQRPCDFNQDGTLDISDPTALLNHLFTGGAAPACGGSIQSPAAIQLLDCNGDARVDLSDAICKLAFLFQGGPPPAGGTECILIESCDDVCDP